MNIISKLRRYATYVLLNILVGRTLYIVSFFISRKNDIWIFGSWSGKRFSDNSKYLFLYVANNHKDIKPIWISKDKDIVRKLRIDNYNAYYAYESKGIYYNLKAKYIFSDSYFDSVNFWCCRGAIKIQLWHGIPLKKIEYDAKNLPWNKNLIGRFKYFCAFPWVFTKYDYIVCTSDFFIGTFASAFRIKKEKIIVSGYPRTDVLFKDVNIDSHNNITKFAKLICNPNSQFILYMPTFRDSDLSNKYYNIDIIKFKELNNFLRQVNCYFILKPHPDIKLNLKYNYDRIIILPNDFDIYQILSQVDILVTDYSSIYFDFLIIDKPIIFFPYDLEKYLKDDRELYFDYDSFTPGPKSFTFEELLYWIDYYVKNLDDKFMEKRKTLRNLSFNYIDGESSTRLYNFVRNLKFKN